MVLVRCGLFWFGRRWLLPRADPVTEVARDPLPPRISIVNRSRVDARYKNVLNFAKLLFPNFVACQTVVPLFGRFEGGRWRCLRGRICFSDVLHSAKKKKKKKEC